MMFEILSTCKGGGYMYCRTSPPHPKANSKGLYPLHRVVVENKIGRLLESWEDVHHMDEDKSNNDPNNLEVLTKPEHGRKHRKIILMHFVCPCCKKPFSVRGNIARKRQKQNKSGVLYCSRSCGATNLIIPQNS